MVNIFELILRIFSSIILALFASVPGVIAAHTFIGFFESIDTFGWQSLLVFVVSLFLFYFLGLLAYRAFTGRGRKEDDGLLPPWALKLFAGAFGVVAILIIFLGIYKGKFIATIVGAGYLFCALSAHGIAKWRQKQDKIKA